MLELVGVMSRETSVAGVTVSVVDADTPPEAAVIVVEPAATEAANPSDPAALLTVATLIADELHAAVLVRSWVVLSENVPVTMNCRVVPLAMLGLVGVMDRETSVAGVAESLVSLKKLPRLT
jgi:hypothetical protein